jgi:uncharacterized protein YjbJ (UPF0337 family)
MTTLQIKGDWNVIKGKLKQKYAKLTDDDLRYEEGCEDELLGRMQKVTGETRETIEHVIEEFGKLPRTR